MIWEKIVTFCSSIHPCWLLKKFQPSPQEKNPDVLRTLKTSLQDLSSMLDHPEVRGAIEALPQKFMAPLIQGLIVVLTQVREYLNQLKSQQAPYQQDISQPDPIAALEEWLDSANGLLAASSEPAVAQTPTVGQAKQRVGDLQNLPHLTEIESLLTLINDLFCKLEELSAYGSSDAR
jgi:hypothetical protein